MSCARLATSPLCTKLKYDSLVVSISEIASVHRTIQSVELTDMMFCDYHLLALKAVAIGWRASDLLAIATNLTGTL